MADDGTGFNLQAVDSVIHGTDDLMTVPDVLAQNVRIPDIFDDWEAAVTYYADWRTCKG